MSQVAHTHMPDDEAHTHHSSSSTHTLVGSHSIALYRSVDTTTLVTVHSSLHWFFPCPVAWKSLPWERPWSPLIIRAGLLVVGLPVAKEKKGGRPSSGHSWKRMTPPPSHAWKSIMLLLKRPGRSASTRCSRLRWRNPWKRQTKPTRKP